VTGTSVSPVSDGIHGSASRIDRALLAIAVGLIVLVATTGVVGAIDLAGERGATSNPSPQKRVVAAAPGAADVAPVAHTHASEYDVQYRDLPTPTRGELDVARDIIARYPIAADAERDGWQKATINLKGIASHYLKGGVRGFLGIDGAFDVRDPEILLFNGEGPDAPIAGVSYLLNGPDPEGFAGKWDVWHRHDAVCFARGLVIAEVGGHEGSRIDMSREECAAQGGIIFPLSNLTMLHVWMKQGFESTAGVFSHDHPELYG
jgi:hypothetical protein